jgi:hypothetical protein
LESLSGSVKWAKVTTRNIRNLYSARLNNVCQFSVH